MDEKQKNKEQMRLKRKRNESLIFLSKKMRGELGVRAIQAEDSSFYLCNGLFLKIYSIEAPALPEEKKIKFIGDLGRRVPLRLRLTSFHKLRGGKLSKLMFLSVFVEASNYAEAYEIYRNFDMELEELHPENYGIKIGLCGINASLMYARMNFNGQLGMYDYQKALKRQKDWGKDILPNLEMTERHGYRDLITGKYGICYCGTELPSQMEDFYPALCKLGIEFRSCVDFQQYSEQEQLMYLKKLEKKYHCCFQKKSMERQAGITFLFCICASTYEELLASRDKATLIFREQGLVLIPCPERQKEAYYSLCSLGMTEYHAMRSASLDVIANLPI